MSGGQVIENTQMNYLYIVLPSLGRHAEYSYEEQLEVYAELTNAMPDSSIALEYKTKQWGYPDVVSPDGNVVESITWSQLVWLLNEKKQDNFEVKVLTRLASWENQTEGKNGNVIRLVSCSRDAHSNRNREWHIGMMVFPPPSTSPIGLNFR